MAAIVVSPDGVVYHDADVVPEHIAVLAEHDPDTLTDLALGLLADLERERGNA
jgi:hypothetical protein